jgi:urocanate hydratase
VLNKIMAESPEEIQQQMQDNITWIKDAKQNILVVVSQARILYTLNHRLYEDGERLLFYQF